MTKLLGAHTCPSLDLEERRYSKPSWGVRIAVLAALLSMPILDSPTMDAQETLPPIGQINFFGYGGVDLRAVELALPIKPGEVLELSRLESTQHLIEERIKTVVGRDPSNIDFVCCDEHQHLLIYIGLAGIGSRPPFYAAPTHVRRLDPVALELYRQDLDALMPAMQRGDAGEDDSQGYALNTDASLRKIQLAIRAYAVDRGPEFEAVLRDSNDAKQRSTAAALLGYARRSPEQIKTLLNAILDPDSEVRNNAVRALFVLTSVKDAPRLEADVKPLVALLNSGVWSDRNKSSLLLDQLTRTRNPAILETLRRTAFDALVEGASWHGDPGHADAFVILLGRMANVPEDRILPESRGTGLGAIISKARSHQP
jgi:hypothetical protein